MFAWFYKIIMMFRWFFKKEETPVYIKEEEPKFFKGYKICEDDEQLIVIYQVTKIRNVEECRNHLKYIYFGKCIKKVKCFIPKYAQKDNVKDLLDELNNEVKYTPTYRPSKTTVHLFLGEGVTENRYVKSDGSVEIITF